MFAIVYALWLVTSTYSTQLAVYPSVMACSAAGLGVASALEKPPRPVLGRLVCLPLVKPIAPPNPDQGV